MRVKLHPIQLGTIYTGVMSESLDLANGVLCLASDESAYMQNSQRNTLTDESALRLHNLFSHADRSRIVAILQPHPEVGAAPAYALQRRS